LDLMKEKEEMRPGCSPAVILKGRGARWRKKEKRVGVICVSTQG